MRSWATHVVHVAAVHFAELSFAAFCEYKNIRKKETQVYDKIRIKPRTTKQAGPILTLNCRVQLRRVVGKILIIGA